LPKFSNSADLPELVKTKILPTFKEIYFCADMAKKIQQKTNNTGASSAKVNIQRQSQPSKGAAANLSKSDSAKKMPPTIVAAIILAAISLLIYSNTLNNKYVLDDFTVIKNNSIITKGIEAIPTIFTTPYRRGWFITTNDLYRPLSLATFAIEYQLLRGEPELMHVLNMLIYAGCVLGLFFFLDELFQKKRTVAAFIAAFLFAVHPIHTEVVANIKSRDELLCFFFAFLSLNVFLKYLKTDKLQHLLLGAACLFLSLISKESTVTFLAIVPFVFFFYRNENKKASILITVSTVAVTVIFLVVRMSVLHAYNADNASYVIFIDNFLVGAPLVTRWATAILILGYYMRLLVVPYPLICDYSYNSIPLVGFGNIYVILSLLFYGAVVGWGIVRFIKNRKDPYAFAIIYFVVTISLFSNIVFVIGAAMAERFTFFCSAGFCWAVALLAETFVIKPVSNDLSVLRNGKSLAFLLPVGLVFGLLTYNRNNDWYDNQTLFRADVQKSPKDSRLTYYLGTELATDAKTERDQQKKMQMLLEGVQNLYQSKAVYPEYNDVLSELGDAYFMLGKVDSAELYDNKAIALNPKNSLAINNLAGIYFTRKDYRNALTTTQKALEINPNYVNAWSNIALCYLHLGIYDSGVIVLRKALTIDPNFGAAYENLALLQRAMGAMDSARYYAGIAQKYNPAFKI
jgi:protein O-mannosyl-transferase